MTDGPADRLRLGGVFNEVPELYDRVRPTYPDDAVRGPRRHHRHGRRLVGARSRLRHRTGDALAGRDRLPVTAVEPGAGLAALARDTAGRRSATSRSRRRRSRTGTTAADASTCWWPRRRGTGSTRRSAGAARTTCSIPAAGWRCSATSSSAGRASRRSTPRPPICTSGSPPETPTGAIHRSRRTCSPPSEGWGPLNDPGGLFGPTIVRWYPTVQWFDGAGFADLLRSTSLYRRLDRDVREPLLDAIAERIARGWTTVPRRYLSVLRAGRRVD